MSTIHLFKKIRSLRLTPLEVVAAISAIVIMISAPIIEDRPGALISSATASEAKANVENATLDGQQKSWSDEWYEIHQSIPHSVAEDVQAF